jgi:serine/threonine-protein kinase
MARIEYDHNLLFGVLALQIGLIDQSKLVAAFQAWTLAPDRPLAEHLIARGELSCDDRAAIEALVACHLKRHCGSTEESLAVIPAGRSIREQLDRSPDSKLEDILANLESRVQSTERHGSGASGPSLFATLDPAHVDFDANTSAGPPSILARIDALAGRVSRVRLPGTGPEAEDNRREGSANVGIAGRYPLLCEIAHGGMGIVHKAHDPELGRDLALKVMRDLHRHRPDLVHRFVEEAQICGQLQHPGIVPVYELGMLNDNRPFFTMKLVKGQTLATLLGERGRVIGERGRVSAPSSLINPGANATGLARTPGADATGLAADLPRFLSIFEQVCQTVAYAHARDVIHRDLKPSNVMVGSFGEVQVMDWGLAKVLPRSGQADPPGGLAANETIVATARSRSDSDLSLAGTVLGTPAYMAPEQARGETTTCDRRADVFALGSILTEILTGEPAFGGASADEILARAAKGDTSAALTRLDLCAADPELLALARDCLSASRAERPPDAGVVAERMTAYLGGVQERLRTAELAGAAESARALEAQRTAKAALAKAAAERQARRLTGALALTFLLACGLGGAGWRWFELEQIHEAHEATRRVNAALHSAVRLHGRAREAALGDLGPWAEAVAAAEKAHDLLMPGVDAALRRQVDHLANEVVAERGNAEAAANAAGRDRRLLERLVEIRLAEADDWGGSMTDLAYADAFREAGMDFSAGPAGVVAAIRAIGPRPMAVVAAALDDWAAVRRDKKKDQASALVLSAVAREVDTDPWRNRLRTALESPNQAARLAVLKDLAKEMPFDIVGPVGLDVVGPVGLDLLGRALRDAGDPSDAQTVLRRARQRYPGDVWINYDLAMTLEKLSRRDEAIRYYTAARSLRPDAAHELAHALASQGESDEGIGVLRDLVRLRPTNGRHLGCLGNLLRSRGRSQEAAVVLETAVAVLRDAVRRAPEDAYAHFSLGYALGQQGKHDEAIAEYREDIRIQRDDAVAHDNLGVELQELGKLDEAIAEHRTAIQLQPQYAIAHESLGSALDEQGKLEAAIAHFRDAIRIQPDFNRFHDKLGWALYRQDKRDEAIAQFRTAIRLKPDDAIAHNNLGLALAGAGKRSEAIAEYRAAMRHDPEYARPHYNLGGSFFEERKLAEAIAEYRAAVRLDPEFAVAHNDLAWCLATHPIPDERRPAEAVEHARRAVAIEPLNGSYYNTLALAEYRAENWAESRTASAESLRRQGPNSYDWFVLAIGSWREGEKDQSLTYFDKAVAQARADDLRDSGLIALWREAAAMLGRPEPSTISVPTAELPAQPFAPWP